MKTRLFLDQQHLSRLFFVHNDKMSPCDEIAKHKNTRVIHQNRVEMPWNPIWCRGRGWGGGNYTFRLDGMGSPILHFWANDCTPNRFVIMKENCDGFFRGTNSGVNPQINSLKSHFGLFDMLNYQIKLCFRKFIIIKGISAFFNFHSFSQFISASVPVSGFIYMGATHPFFSALASQPA